MSDKDMNKTTDIENNLTDSINSSKDNISINNSANTRVYNIQNLKPFNPKYSNTLTAEEAQKRGRNGGIKSGEVRRARKTMKDTILDLIQKEVNPDDYGGDVSILGDKATLQDVIIAAMIREAANGDTKSMQLLRDTIGEQPIQKSEVKNEIITKEDLQAIDNLKKYLTS